MSVSSRAEEDNKRKTDEKKEGRMKDDEMDIEAKAPGTQLDDGKGVNFSYWFLLSLLNFTLYIYKYIYSSYGDMWRKPL